MPEHPRADSEGYVFEHILFAEKAFGGPLPHGTEVHHFNEIKSDNSPGNLVLCHDRAYHFLLHKRMRRLRRFGDVNRKDLRVKI